MGILRKLFEYTHNISLNKKSKEDFQEEFGNNEIDNNEINNNKNSIKKLLKNLKKIIKNEKKFIEELKLFIFLNEKNLIDEKNGIINIYSFFLKAISKNFKVDDLYNNIPKYIQNYLLDNETNINENDLILLNKFKENILNVKLELFKNIENNKESFKEFQKNIKGSNLEKYFEIIETIDDNLSEEQKTKIKNENLKKEENNAKLLTLSFYFYQNNINNIEKNKITIENSIIKAKNSIDNNFFNNFTINNSDLNLLSSFDNDFSFGFEYEFWINSKYLKENSNHYITENSNASINSLDDIFNILNSNRTNDETNINKNLSNNYENIKVIIENNDMLNKINNNTQQYFEIISKKFNSISEMLVFNDFTLNLINNIKISNEKDILVNKTKIENEFKENNKTKIVTNSNMIEGISKKQDILFNNFPGSIHFNISNPEIQKMNKVKFFLFLKESNLMNKWKIRNDNVKDLSSLVDVFGPFIIESNIVDKLWQINFSYLNNKDKNGNINHRLEIRYMGGFDYPNKINDINKNILKIMECVNKSINIDLNKKQGNGKENDNEYLDLLNKYDVDRNWNDLNKEEINLLEKIFDIKDIKKDIDFLKYMKELEKKFNELKKEINNKKDVYYGR